MFKIKNISITILSIVLILLLFACGGKTNNNNNKTEETVPPTQVADNQTQEPDFTEIPDNTAEVKETVTPTNKTTYAQTTEPTKAPTTKPTTAPTQKPTATPTPTAKPCYTRDGDYIYFGSYPQSEVTDSALKSALTAAAGSSSNWTSYNYYIEGKSSDFMKYKDVTYNSNKYRGVYFTQYRPSWTDYNSQSDYSDQDNNGYYTSTIYWFKYESIKWKILSESKDDAFLVADMLLDAQDYNHTLDNNYANSSIKTWLNSTFYNDAFNTAEQGEIKDTMVDNSASSTVESSNPYICDDTNDKIFLLSYKEIMDKSIGFSGNTTRVKKLTPYAKAQGAISYSDSGKWWLRSPYDFSDCASYVNNDGYVYHSYDDYVGNYYYQSVNVTACGIAPAMHLKLK